MRKRLINHLVYFLCNKTGIISAGPSSHRTYVDASSQREKGLCGSTKRLQFIQMKRSNTLSSIKI